MVNRIEIRRPTSDELNKISITNWNEWTSEVGNFEWEYMDHEEAYFFEGRVIVTPEDGSPVEIQAGCLAKFPKGMKCRWQVIEPVRKVYKLG